MARGGGRLAKEVVQGFSSELLLQVEVTMKMMVSVAPLHFSEFLLPLRREERDIGGAMSSDRAYLNFFFVFLQSCGFLTFAKCYRRVKP